MYTLRFENSSGKSVTLTQNDNFAINLLDGFYSSSATINTTKVGTKAGERLASKSVNKRNLGVHFSIKKEVVRNRKDLYNMFRTGEQLTVYYTNEIMNVSIPAIVEDITILPHDMKTTGSIIFVCPYPYFSDINEIIDSISQVVDNFTFPFAIESTGKAFSYLDTVSEINIFNGGNVETGMKIRMKAMYGEVTNPIIYNRRTTKFIGLGTEDNPFILESGDELIIDTENKKVKLISDGVESNVFNSLIPNITWLTLIPEDNVFTFNADEGLINLEIEFIHQDQYEGV